MDTHELAREVQQMQRELTEIKGRISRLPDRISVGGGAPLPPGGDRYEVLMIVDDAGTVDWSIPRFALRIG